LGLINIFLFFSFFNEIALFLFPSHSDRSGELVKLILSVIGGLCVIYGLYISNRRAKATDQSVKMQNAQIELSLKSQIDDRFKNAIEHLGNEKEPIILGGIAELHQISKENSEKYSEVVFNILCSYIRAETNIYEKRANDFNSAVISTIINYLFKAAPDNPYNPFFANLRSSNLLGQEIVNCNLLNANLSFCYLGYVQNSILDNADLSCSDISNSFFQNNSMNGVNLFHTRFMLVTFKQSSFKKLKSEEKNHSMITYFINCKFIYVSFDDIDIYKSIFIGCIFYNCTFTNTRIMHTSFYVCSFSDISFSDVKDLYEINFSASIFHDTVICNNIYHSIFKGCSIKKQNIVYISIEGQLSEQKNIESNINNLVSLVLYPESCIFGKLTDDECNEIIDKYEELKIIKKLPLKIDVPKENIDTE